MDKSKDDGGLTMSLWVVGILALAIGGAWFLGLF